ncbi:MAG: DUF6290 family protein [Coriobacteriia bacterium]|nr:DUF6290 family protein [Coriobacteriia bacterium]MCL2536868.1 DUF6290 family protein [Coriobacteriia bacterium]
MSKVSTAIRFAPEEKSWIQKYADFQGKSFSDVVRDAVLEKIEDEADLRAYDVALASNDGTSYSMDEIDKIFDGR